jgi:hypothetical protein
MFTTVDDAYLVTVLRIRDVLFRIRGFFHPGSGSRILRPKKGVAKLNMLFFLLLMVSGVSFN